MNPPVEASNGSPVSRAELAAHIKGIDEHFDVLESAVLRIENKIDSQATERRADRDTEDESRRADRRAWHPAIVAAIVAGLVSVAPALPFFH